MPRKLKKSSLEIIERLQKGESWFSIYKKTGYSRMTCKYYYWKLKKPEQFKSFVSQIVLCSKNSDTKKKNVNIKKDIKL